MIVVYTCGCHVENGLEMVLWIGQQASPEFVMNVFGVNSQAEINAESVCKYLISTCSAS